MIVRRLAVGAALIALLASCADGDAGSGAAAEETRAPVASTASVAESPPPPPSTSESTPPSAAPETIVSSEPTPVATTSAPPNDTSAMGSLEAPTTSDAAPTVADVAAACVTELDLRDRVALLVWPAVYSAAWGEARDAVAGHGVGGVVLMKPEGWDASTLTAQLDELDAASRHGLVIATDEEGGDVQRLSLLGPLPSQQEVSTTRSTAEARQLVGAHGVAVRASGVDMVLGPVVDVEPAVGEVPLQSSRLFAGPPETVTAYADAYLAGWNDAGLTAVLKHYPGHGAASGDTHVTEGVTPPLDELEQRDLVPYRALAGRGAAVMAGHLTVPGLTDGLPASISPTAIAYLRESLGYRDALILSDALGMAAIGLPEPDAAVRSIAAGVDVVLFTRTSQTGAVIDALVAAVQDGRIPTERIDAAAGRVMRQLAVHGDGCAATS